MALNLCYSQELLLSCQVEETGVCATVNINEALVNQMLHDSFKASVGLKMWNSLFFCDPFIPRWLGISRYQNLMLR